MTTLRPYLCGSRDVAVQNDFGLDLYVLYGDCGAQGRSFPISTMVGNVWPREAAERAWNAGEMEGA
jgi:hypothetical protein